MFGFVFFFLVEIESRGYLMRIEKFLNFLFVFCFEGYILKLYEWLRCWVYWGILECVEIGRMGLEFFYDLVFVNKFFEDIFIVFFGNLVD